MYTYITNKVTMRTALQNTCLLEAGIQDTNYHQTIYQSQITISNIFGCACWVFTNILFPKATLQMFLGLNTPYRIQNDIFDEQRITLHRAQRCWCNWLLNDPSRLLLHILMYFRDLDDTVTPILNWLRPSVTTQTYWTPWELWQ